MQRVKHEQKLDKLPVQDGEVSIKPELTTLSCLVPVRMVLSSIVNQSMKFPIFTTTDYFTRWTEAIPLKIINHDQVISFIKQLIITRFGAPNTLVFENASYFSSIKLIEFALGKVLKSNILVIIMCKVIV
jgi:hypothetical protein